MFKVSFSEKSTNYLIRHWVSSRPKGGRGELKNMAEHLRIPSSVFSQILSGMRSLSEEQAHSLAGYMGLSELECEYFIGLAQVERAANHDYKSYLKKKLEGVRAKARNLGQRMSYEKVLSEKDQAEFYSSWIYSAVRLFCGLKGGADLEQIMNEFHLQRAKAQRIVQFLLSVGLIEERSKKYVSGSVRTHVGRESPFALRHHANWRIRAMEKSTSLLDDDLMFSGPMSLSQQDFEKVQKRLLEVVHEISEVVKDSPAEMLACFNVDFFRIL